MMLYRQQRSRVDTLPLLRCIQEEAASLRLVARPTRDAIEHVLIDAGEFASGVSDARASERDSADVVSDGCLAVVVHLARAAEASSCDRPNDVASALEDCMKALARCAAFDLPRTIDIGVSEGFAYYAVWPELYADAARVWAEEEKPQLVWCVGLRTIGLALAAAVAATLHSRNVRTSVISLRPRGHPFDREVLLDGQLSAALTASTNAWWLIIDEGPGISGSSMAGTARCLSQLGIPDERIVLMPSYPPDVSRLVAGARKQWERHRICAADYDTTWMTTGRLAREWDASALVDIAAGAWRGIAGLKEPVPAAHPQHERRKYLVRRQSSTALLKFTGLGRYGRTLAARLEEAADASWSPRPAQCRGGWTELPWIDEHADANRRTFDDVSQLADYLSFILRTRDAGRTTDVDALVEMALTNTRELCGDTAARALSALPLPPTTPAVFVDARLRPHEWVRLNGKLQKIDGTEHGDDHFFPGPCDIAWDVAGAIEEWQLREGEAAYLVTRLVNASGDRWLPQRLPFYCAAYLAFRAGYTACARDQLAGTREAARFGQEHNRYKARLEAVLACAS